ncbi:hypothetical protein MWU76_15370 [Gelidibacter sp. F2691]|nr:hypothetical protein [Gelidibacter sp. F2691]
MTMFVGLSASAQELTCADFREGSFYVPADDETLLSYTITRTGTQHIETVEDPNNLLGADFNKTAYAIIEWIDACTYRLTYDGKQMALSDYQKDINQKNGFLVSLETIEGPCFYFKSALSDQDQEQIIKGKLCKDQ